MNDHYQSDLTTKEKKSRYRINGKEWCKDKSKSFFIDNNGPRGKKNSPSSIHMQKQTKLKSCPNKKKLLPIFWKYKIAYIKEWRISDKTELLLLSTYFVLSFHGVQRKQEIMISILVREKLPQLINTTKNFVITINIMNARGKGGGRRVNAKVYEIAQVSQLNTTKEMLSENKVKRPTTENHKAKFFTFSGSFSTRSWSVKKICELKK